MASTDLREAINALSEIVMNRPPPLRETDQIYMKLADMYLQADHVCRYMKNKDVIFIGDGDALALAIIHLQQINILPSGPSSVTILDFDERVINSVNRFAERKGYSNIICASLYNVADPIPKQFWQTFEVFYTNPPYGSTNDGVSVEVFICRGIETCKDEAMGCIVIADSENLKWTREILYNTQRLLIDKGFYIAEMVPRFHSYHLEDAPDLMSCSIIVKRLHYVEQTYASESIRIDQKHNFYGKNSPLRWKYIKDKRDGGKYPSRDHNFIKFKENQK